MDRGLGKRARQCWLVAHVASSVGWFGVAASQLALKIIAHTTDSDAVRHTDHLTAQVFDRYLMIPLVLVALGTGLVLSLCTKWGLLRHYWVTAKFVLTIALMIADTIWMGGWVAEAVEYTASGGASAAPGYRDTLAHLLAGSVVNLVAILAMVVLSVVKPFGRTSRGRRVVRRVRPA
ncbi:hypothetical protein ACFWY9_27285 [Amycolatopsis sp. NPDC059027]|uniref:hypothetical protein n=1 Tax=Amycolatopsis sp. NPDC059027 TaxID=3346709 RepID=UPI0036710B8B